jgi:hypothetical protein
MDTTIRDWWCSRNILADIYNVGLRGSKQDRVEGFYAD